MAHLGSCAYTRARRADTEYFITLSLTDFTPRVHLISEIYQYKIAMVCFVEWMDY